MANFGCFFMVYQRIVASLPTGGVGEEILISIARGAFQSTVPYYTNGDEDKR